MLTRLILTSDYYDQTLKDADKGHIEYWVFMHVQDIAENGDYKGLNTKLMFDTQIEELIKGELLDAMGAF